MRLRLLLLAIACLFLLAPSQTSIDLGVDIEEVDQSPQVTGAQRLVVTNGALANDGVVNGKRQVTLTMGGGGTDVQVDTGGVLPAADFQDSASILFTDTAGVVTAGIATGSVSATELDEAGVRDGLEAVLRLDQLQSAVTDAQVPDTITIDLAATAAALAADPSDCAGGNDVAIGVLANGQATCADANTKRALSAQEIDADGDTVPEVTINVAGDIMELDLDEDTGVDYQHDLGNKLWRVDTDAATGTDWDMEVKIGTGTPGTQSCAASDTGSDCKVIRLGELGGGWIAWDQDGGCYYVDDGDAIREGGEECIDNPSLTVSTTDALDDVISSGAGAGNTLEHNGSNFVLGIDDIWAPGAGVIVTPDRFNYAIKTPGAWTGMGAAETDIVPCEDARNGDPPHTTVSAHFTRDEEIGDRLECEWTYDAADDAPRTYRCDLATSMHQSAGTPGSTYLYLTVGPEDGWKNSLWCNGSGDPLACCTDGDADGDPYTGGGTGTCETDPFNYAKQFHEAETAIDFTRDQFNNGSSTFIEHTFSDGHSLQLLGYVEDAQTYAISNQAINCTERPSAASPDIYVEYLPDCNTPSCDITASDPRRATGGVLLLGTTGSGSSPDEDHTIRFPDTFEVTAGVHRGTVGVSEEPGDTLRPLCFCPGADNEFLPPWVAGGQDQCLKNSTPTNGDHVTWVAVQGNGDTATGADGMIQVIEKVGPWLEVADASCPQ